MNSKQYAIIFTSDWTWDIIHEIGNYMDILIEDEALDRALDEKDTNSPNNIAIFYDKNNTINMIVACCFDNDIFHSLIVRCDLASSENVNKKLLQIDSDIRLMAKQDLQTELKDLSNDKEHGLNLLTAQYNIKF